VKRFDSLQFLNLIDSLYVSLVGRSDCLKAATYTGKYKHRINAEIHVTSGIGTHNPSV
jgi:hypothetical protein